MYRQIKSTLCLSVALRVLLGPSAMANDIAVVMSPDAGPLSRDQVAAIYLGRSHTLTPIDMPESNGLRAVFYTKATDRDPAQVKALWSRLIFTGQGQPPRELPDAAAVKKAVAADRKLIGYIDSLDVDATVKVVLALH
jgi:hypothetical protein